MRDGLLHAFSVRTFMAWAQGYLYIITVSEDIGHLPK
jgi:hypothetical protein